MHLLKLIKAYFVFYKRRVMALLVVTLGTAVIYMTPLLSVVFLKTSIVEEDIGFTEPLKIEMVLDQTSYILGEKIDGVCRVFNPSPNAVDLFYGFKITNPQGTVKEARVNKQVEPGNNVLKVSDVAELKEFLDGKEGKWELSCRLETFDQTWMSKFATAQVKIEAISSTVSNFSALQIKVKEVFESRIILEWKEENKVGLFEEETGTGSVAGGTEEQINTETSEQENTETPEQENNETPEQENNETIKQENTGTEEQINNETEEQINNETEEQINNETIEQETSEQETGGQELVNNINENAPIDWDYKVRYYTGEAENQDFSPTTTVFVRLTKYDLGRKEVEVGGLLPGVTYTLGLVRENPETGELEISNLVKATTKGISAQKGNVDCNAKCSDGPVVGDITGDYCVGLDDAYLVLYYALLKNWNNFYISARFQGFLLQMTESEFVAMTDLNKDGKTDTSDAHAIYKEAKKSDKVIE